MPLPVPLPSLPLVPSLADSTVAWHAVLVLLKLASHAAVAETLLSDEILLGLRTLITSNLKPGASRPMLTSVLHLVAELQKYEQFSRRLASGKWRAQMASTLDQIERALARTDGSADTSERGAIPIRHSPLATRHSPLAPRPLPPSNRRRRTSDSRCGVPRARWYGARRSGARRRLRSFGPHRSTEQPLVVHGAAVGHGLAATRVAAAGAQQAAAEDGLDAIAAVAARQLATQYGRQAFRRAH